MIANRIAYGETLTDLAKENKDIVVLDADACKSTGILKVREEAPEAFIECGIAEQNMMGIAAGLAMCGKVPFVTTFAVFTCMRAVEQVRNAVCYSNVSVKITGTHAGLETGGDGGTHQAIEDISIMRSLPNMKVTVPATPNATRKITRLAAKTDGPFYMRLGKDPTPEIYSSDEEFPLGGSKELKKGNDLAIVACGSMVWRSMEAAKQLESEGIQARVIDLYSIKPIDKECLIKASKETKGILTVEDHTICGGMGSAVAEVLAEYAPAKMKRMGLADVFGRSGNAKKLYEMYGLTPEDIAAKAKELLSSF